VEVGAIANNIIAILLKCMAKYGGLLVEKLDSRWVNIGCDRDFVFERHRIGVTSQLKSCVTLFLIGVH
jgi:hypothetical protein